MRKISTDLFDLIQSLNPAEKRYFKLYAQRHSTGRKANYLRLFEAMNSQPEYDEDALRRKFKKEKFLQQFAVAKNYLYGMILDALTEIEDATDERFGVWRLKEQTALLFRKGLYKQCLKVLKRAKEKAYHLELYDELPYLLGYESNICLRNIIQRDKAEWLNTIAQEQGRALEILRQEHDLKLCYNQLTCVMDELWNHVADGKYAQKLHEIMQHPALSESVRPFTQSSARIYYNSHLLYYRFTENIEGSIRVLKEQIEFYRASPHYIRSSPSSYYFALLNLIVCLLDNSRHDEARKAMEDIDEAHTRYAFKITQRLQGILLEGYSSRLRLMYQTGDMTKADETLAIVERTLSLQSQSIAGDKSVGLRYYAAAVCFVLQRYEDALRYIHPLAQETLLSGKKIFYSEARLLHIILHFELGNYTIIEPLAEALRRFIAKHEMTFPFYDPLLRGLVKAAVQPTTEKRKQVLAKLEKTILSMNNIPHHHLAILWIRAKVQGLPFRSLSREVVVKP